MKEYWTELNGTRIRYFESGTENDRHVLFIHGLGSSADRWLGIPDALSPNLHTVALDLPGFGKSDKPKIDYTIQSFTDTIIDFIKNIGINTKTSIVGHSLGGYIASEVAIQNKNQIERLALIDSSGFLEKPTPLLEEYLKVAINPTEDSVRRVFEQMVADPARIPKKLVESFITRINLPNAKYAFESTLQYSTNTQIGLERLRQLDSIPTLVIWGIKDEVIPIDHLEFFKNITNSKIEIIEDTGHAPFAEKPEQIGKMLRNFLK